MSAFKRRRAEMEQPECEACGSTAIVIDQKQGHMVCDDCGVIKRESMISASSEYRNFSESDKPSGAAVRLSWAVRARYKLAVTSCSKTTMCVYIAPKLY
jgi:transcription initiation factor TFIIIB Brf1 subunit/transcription initiation factor TFIIB